MGTMMKAIRTIAIALILITTVARADDAATEPTSQPEHHDKKSAATTQKNEEPIVAEHELKLGDTSLKYKSTTGFITLTNAEEKPRAKVFFIAYERSARR